MVTKLLKEATAMDKIRQNQAQSCQPSERIEMIYNLGYYLNSCETYDFNNVSIIGQYHNSSVNKHIKQNND